MPTVRHKPYTPTPEEAEFFGEGAELVEVEPGIIRFEGVHFMTAERSRAEFDRLAHEWFGISGKEFLRRYDAGEYDDILDDPEHPHVLWLSTMRPGDC